MPNIRGSKALMAEHWAAVAGAAQPIQLCALWFTEELITLLTRGKLRRWVSVSKNTNSLSFLMGPPMVPPRIWRTSGGLMAALPVAVGSRAFSVRLRKNQKNVPWKSLVPLLVMVLMTPPEALPNSAE